jgi:hypothetical protein
MLCKACGTSKLHSRKPGRSSKAARMQANHGLRVPVAGALHATNDGLDATAEDEAVCRVVVELFSFAVVEGRSGSDWATHHTRRWCESEMRYSAALDPRVGDRVMPTSTKTAHHAQVQLETIRPTSKRSITSYQKSPS